MSGKLPTGPTGVILRADEASAWADGFGFLKAAREQADTLIQKGLADAEQARREAVEEGRRQAAEAAAALLASTHAHIDRYLAGLEESLAALALEIVRQVIEGLDDAERIARITGKALAEFRSEQALSLHVAPDQEQAVRAGLGELLGDRTVPVIGDAQLSGTQATLVGPSTVVDLDLDAQLDSIARALASGDHGVTA